MKGYGQRRTVARLTLFHAETPSFSTAYWWPYPQFPSTPFQFFPISIQYGFCSNCFKKEPWSVDYSFLKILSSWGTLLVDSSSFYFQFTHCPGDSTFPTLSLYSLTGPNLLFWLCSLSVSGLNVHLLFYTTSWPIQTNTFKGRLLPHCDTHPSPLDLMDCEWTHLDAPWFSLFHTQI
jgi:hypothetical protein